MNPEQAKQKMIEGARADYRAFSKIVLDRMQIGVRMEQAYWWAEGVHEGLFGRKMYADYNSFYQVYRTQMKKNRQKTQKSNSI